MFNDCLKVLENWTDKRHLDHQEDNEAESEQDGQEIDLQ